MKTNMSIIFIRKVYPKVIKKSIPKVIKFNTLKQEEGPYV